LAHLAANGIHNSMISWIFVHNNDTPQGIEHFDDLQIREGDFKMQQQSTKKKIWIICHTVVDLYLARGDPGGSHIVIILLA
jgi:hypothetical protein